MHQPPFEAPSGGVSGGIRAVLFLSPFWGVAGVLVILIWRGWIGLPALLLRDGVLVDALRRLPQEGLQFGREADFTLAVGKVVPAPLPPCSVLRTVDRFPPPPR